MDRRNRRSHGHSSSLVVLVRGEAIRLHQIVYRPQVGKDIAGMVEVPVSYVRTDMGNEVCVDAAEVIMVAPEWSRASARKRSSEKSKD